jgi:hypothetical protein
MRKADLKKNHKSLDDSIARYRTFLEKIIAAQRVISRVQDKRDIAESVLLRLAMPYSDWYMQCSARFDFPCSATDSSESCTPHRFALPALW